MDAATDVTQLPDPIDLTRKKMREALDAEGLTQEEIAEYLGVARQTVAAWLSPNRGPDPSVAMLRLWALRCGVPYEWLTNGVAPAKRAGGFRTKP